ncbi:Actin-related protein 2/3 complex subunit 1A [Zea mays]|uniref:Actin-related protein 2/3 complex subunit n=1 Tax=Zea mays TaxID=4577 RepID=A0A1D6HPJ9_MAIZE|nr:Actin-related protein 2/3 complex subunit 1A [Zea mays]
MAAAAIHQFAECITCHAWSPDQSMIAFCPNNHEVHIYKFFTDKWEKLHVLSKGIGGYIYIFSFDLRYVWTQEGSDWIPTLVILKLNRAALCVQWSPKENKFAVGSGAKSVCICYYEQENNWWISKVIRKRHESSVTSLAWHPNNIYLATTSTDGKCRVFSTFIKGVDTRGSQSSTSTNSKFGEQIAQLDLSSTWVFGVRWSPSGKTLAYAGSRSWHNSMVYVIDEVESSPVAQNLTLRDLPLRDVLFVSERTLVGVGFDCNPMIFAADDTGLWSFVRFLDEMKAAPSASKASQVYTLHELIIPGGTTFQLSEALGKLYGQSKQGASSDTVEPSKARGGAHENCITCIVPLRKGSDGTIKRFSTSGLDGKVVVWDLENHVSIAK